jgi:hypothetical protein
VGFAALAFAALFLASAAEAKSVQQLRNDAEALEKRVTRLEDVSAIERLQRAYGYYVDKSQFREVADLFATDGVLEIGGRGQFLGRERAFEYLDKGLGGDGMRQGFLQDHQQFSPIVTVAPDGLHADARVAAHVVAGNGWGDVTYENTYVKRDGTWQIYHQHARFNMYSGYGVGWMDNTTPNTRPESFAPPPDIPPSTLLLTFPNYYIAPFHYVNPVTGRPAPPPLPTAGGAALGRDETTITAPAEAPPGTRGGPQAD